MPPGAPKGNKNATKSKDWEAALRRAIHNYEDDKVARGEALHAIARKVVKKAIQDEDWRAVEEIANRLDGRAPQSVEISGSLNNRKADDLPDDELADIAAGRSAGVIGQEISQEESGGVH